MIEIIRAAADEIVATMGQTINRKKAPPFPHESSGFGQQVAKPQSIVVSGRVTPIAAAV